MPPAQCGERRRMVFRCVWYVSVAEDMGVKFRDLHLSPVGIPIYYSNNSLNVYLRTPSCYKEIFRNYILPYFDDHTRMSVAVRSGVVMTFVLSTERGPPCFTMTECDDYDFLRAHVTSHRILISDLPTTNSMQHHRWTSRDLMSLLGDDCATVSFSKDGFYTTFKLNLWDHHHHHPEEAPPLPIGYLGRMQGIDVYDPLSLLPANEPRRPGETWDDFRDRVTISAIFWEKRYEIWELYKRYHGINDLFVAMIPELLEL